MTVVKDLRVRAGPHGPIPSGHENIPNLLGVVGPTASGKTTLAVKIAVRLGGEIVSADSRQVYREMNLGSGKDLEEYCCEGKPIPYHLIDVVSPTESFSVFDYQQRAVEALALIWKRGRLPILCGGTGLYVDSILRNYRMTAVSENPALREALARLSTDELVLRLLSLRPDYHTRGDFRKRERLVRAIEVAEHSLSHPPEGQPLGELRPLVLYLEWSRSELRNRIKKRLVERLDQGMVEEVRHLRDIGVGWERLETFGLEYRYIARHLKGELDLAEMTERLFFAICRFSKRQETWFRGMEKKGIALYRVRRDSWEDAMNHLIRHGLLPT